MFMVPVFVFVLVVRGGIRLGAYIIRPGAIFFTFLHVIPYRDCFHGDVSGSVDMSSTERILCDGSRLMLILM